MDENLNQQNNGEVNNNGAPIPPSSPPPEITLRTMESDIESVKEAGGEQVVPQAFTPPEIKSESSVDFNTSSNEDNMISAENNVETTSPPIINEQPKSKTKLIVLLTILTLLVATVAYVGYVYIYPIFAQPVISNTTPINSEVAQTEPIVVPIVPEVPVNEIIPIPGIIGDDLDEDIFATSSEEIAPAIPEIIIPPIVKKTHISYLIIDPDLTARLTLVASTSLSSIRDLLISEAENKPETEVSLKEVILSDEGGQLVFSSIFPMFLSEFSSEELELLFEEDFTSVLFYDENGIWLGIIAKIKEGADVASIQTLITDKIESSDNLSNLYISNPGSQSVAGFKDGSANEQSTRYIAFGETGAALNYGWTEDNLLIISTSYNGIKSIYTKLGL
ncbi:hypothetical protein KJ671_02685 [Patescibacteria group bacterium]|nr:hypothetical protein [Patescibacteria group bacterium]